MFDIGWSELLVIGVVALIVIGPKDLPRVLKTVGFYVRKARQVSREFQSSVEQMVREAELEDVKKEIQKVGSLDLKGEIEKTIDPTGDLQKSLEPPVVPTIDPFGEAPKPLPAAAEPSPALEAPAAAPAALIEAPVSTPSEPTAAPAPVPEPASPAPEHAKTGTAG